MVCQEGRARFPNDMELLYQEGVVRRDLGDLIGAEACFLPLLSAAPQQDLALSMDPGLLGYLVRNELAGIYLRQQRPTEAEALWREVVVEQPNLTEAWLGLVEIWRSQGQLGALNAAEDAARRLESNPRTAVEAVLLRGRILMARQAYGAARELLEQAVAKAP